MSGGAYTAKTFTFSITFGSIYSAVMTYRLNGGFTAGSGNNDCINSWSNTKLGIVTDNVVVNAYIIAIGN